MLVEFKIKNYKSFKEETSLLMTQVKSFKEHLNSNIIKTKKDFDLLKTSVFFGANAAGKTNFISGFGSMARFVHESFIDSLKKEEEKVPRDYQFKLNTSTESANTMFEVSFLIGESIYRYGFEINGYEVKKEWLYKKQERETYLFLRDGKKIDVNKVSFKEGLKHKSEVNSNVLFISYLAQINQKVSSSIVVWFKRTNVVSGLIDNHYNIFTARLLRTDSNFQKWISFALKYLEITNIGPGEKETDIVAYHKRYDANNLLVDTVAFNVASMESEGTRKLIYILGPIYDTLKHGKRLFIDEFDSKLHHNLVLKLLELFHDFNRNGAQIIISAHNVSLLDKDIFRRDQIWFVDKDQFGASEVYSLSEFKTKKVRNTSDYNKRYLENEFGASEGMKISKELINLLYDEK